MKNNFYKVVTENGYVQMVYTVPEGQHDYYGQISGIPDVCEGWYRFTNGEFIEDSEKKAEIIAERELVPTWEETIESQVYYTALMTDTLIEEE